MMTLSQLDAATTVRQILDLVHTAADPDAMTPEDWAVACATLDGTASHMPKPERDSVEAILVQLGVLRALRATK